MTRTRVIFLAIIGLAVAIVIAAQFVNFNFNFNTQPVTGLSGSEKIPFFEDERVQAAFRRNGFDVTVQRAGSREIATSYDLGEYDFAWPAGVPAAEQIENDFDTTLRVTPFFSPMAIATWRPVADVLVDAGIATNEGDFYYLLNMDALLDSVGAEQSWEELAQRDFALGGTDVLIKSTDVRTSNSAAMYLSLASYVANGDDIVQNTSQADAILEQMGDLFLRQGFQASSSLEPFQDYLVKGMGQSPMVMIYEAQFIAAAAQENSPIRDEMVLMYPVPTVFSNHVYLGLSEAGAQLGELLNTDDELKRLAIEYGFRNDNLDYFQQYTERNDVNLPSGFGEVVEPPSYEVLEYMIQRIEDRYRQ